MLGLQTSQRGLAIVTKFMNTVGDFTEDGINSFLFTKVFWLALISAEYATVDRDCKTKMDMVLILR